MNNWENPNSDPLQDLTEYITEIRNRQPVFEPYVLSIHEFNWLKCAYPQYFVPAVTDLPPRQGMSVNPYKRQGMRRRDTTTFQTTKDILDHLQVIHDHV